ncbi:hypothetical protein A1Q1_04179 [Trichosporon asahii var. asahii CBS 2479]|uniref:Exosome complex component CSL4 C-terminal domain-containing protein n=1 Tax=Trichosporon asahii var. asahii (strain ATCC 90039 / CBS 2479 / JCM 2466 / KCTC 7840 / NBRC 103889/ NCYC 2677 / UAMH 7654) TaxID=1186058 RepID=J4U944_TRIAS|nr:hypothetical protein A1Q1_04179 [Trichosporon asahii var. asahii CBS 2479]EJT47105.1 hypothetical protein A1Q1_04179 [Trichosporon asahii var. asahii CBS 2479]
MSAPLLLPGQPLPAAFTIPPVPQCGPGCYESQGRILASIVGRPHRDGAVVSVIGKAEAGVVPEIGSIVGYPLLVCAASSNTQIARLSPQQAHVVIQIVNDRPVADSTEELTGVVKMGECFRLGDIVKAKVVSHALVLFCSSPQLSLGDARSYYLSTAANELGVVYATSEDGEHPPSQPVPLTTRQPAPSHLVPGDGGPPDGPHRAAQGRQT